MEMIVVESQQCKLAPFLCVYEPLRISLALFLPSKMTSNEKEEGLGKNNSECRIRKTAAKVPM